MTVLGCLRHFLFTVYTKIDQNRSFFLQSHIILIERFNIHVPKHFFLDLRNNYFVFYSISVGKREKDDIEILRN